MLYTDVITGDEIISDAYKLIDVDDIVYEVDAAMIIVKEGEVDIGANASAEEQSEALEVRTVSDGTRRRRSETHQDGAQTVNNVAHSTSSLGSSAH